MQFHLAFFHPQRNRKYLGLSEIKRANFLNMIYVQSLYYHKETENKAI